MNTKAMLTAAGTLAVGILAGAVLTDLAGGQERVKHTDPVPRSERDLWPPRPENMVSEYFDSVDYGTVPSGGTVHLYHVPSDKWFIMTEHTYQDNIFDILEDLNSNKRLKVSRSHLAFGYNGFPGRYEPGIAFRPGSTVAIQNVSGSSRSFAFSIFGYLADA